MDLTHLKPRLRELDRSKQLDLILKARLARRTKTKPEKAPTAKTKSSHSTLRPDGEVSLTAKAKRKTKSKVLSQLDQMSVDDCRELLSFLETLNDAS